jgi:hypothetical protein
MNNEPVAWLIQAKIWHEFTFSKPAEDSEDVVITPLYTHPHPDNLGLALSIIDQQKLEIERLKAKTLTDEEINEIFSKTWLDLKDYKDFARAILKKASEK